jgi:beta-phosphoglucomutase-like phosphatase (HAD superfamily)
METRALIFDMDGTMIDSMPSHGQSWVTFARQHGIDIDLSDLLQRTTGALVPNVCASCSSANSPMKKPGL